MVKNGQKTQVALHNLTSDIRDLADKILKSWEKFMNSHLNVKYALSAVASAGVLYLLYNNASAILKATPALTKVISKITSSKLLHGFAKDSVTNVVTPTKIYNTRPFGACFYGYSYCKQCSCRPSNCI